MYILHPEKQREGRKAKVDQKMNFKYFYGTEADTYTFYRFPKLLITDETFKGLSSDHNTNGLASKAWQLLKSIGGNPNVITRDG